MISKIGLQPGELHSKSSSHGAWKAKDVAGLGRVWLMGSMGCFTDAYKWRDMYIHIVNIYIYLGGDITY